MNQEDGEQVKTILFYNYLGNSGSFTSVSRIASRFATKTSLTDLAGADKDAVHFFGKKLREYLFNGIVTTYDESIFLETLLNNTGSVNFTSEVGILGAPTYGHFHPDDFYYEDFLTTGSPAGPLINTQVFYKNLTWKDSGARALEREFRLEAVEVT